jgi:glycine cleavage system H protein
LGDVVFVELPTEGTEVAQGGESLFSLDPFLVFPPYPSGQGVEGRKYRLAYRTLTIDSIGAVESVKAASDIYAPVSGVIESINETLADQPSLLNKKPQSDGMYSPAHPSL